MKQTRASNDACATICQTVRYVSVFALLLAGCGDAVAARAPAPATTDMARAPVVARSDGAVSADTLVDVEASSAVPDGPAVPTPGAAAMARSPVGSLRGAQNLRHLYERLADLEAGRAHDDVRILQYGDSHTAADLPTMVVRKALQQRFGDGGRGFVAIGAPWKHYFQDGVHTGMSAEFEAYKGKRVHGKREGDGRYGLLGVSVEATDAAASAWVEGAGSKVDVGYLASPRGGSFDLFVDGVKSAHVSTHAADSSSAWRTLDVSDGTHKIEARASGDGEVRLFGAAFDRAAVGVEIDALGINGAQITAPLSWNEAHFAEQLRHRAPDVVILAYGTNESLETRSSQEYEKMLVDVLGRIARAVPGSSCLLLGPPDRAVADKNKKDEWKTSAKLLEIIDSQRKVAEAAGCAFYDQLEAMGGPGTIALWSTEPKPRAGKDRVHMTRDGYATLASAFVRDLLAAYGAWKSDAAPAPSARR
jgi:lysophospholipase L1-like esterase